MSVEGAKSAVGAACALLPAAGRPGVELADHGEDRREGAAVDADGRAGRMIGTLLDGLITPGDDQARR